jgi:hypothetical protein
MMRVYERMEGKEVNAEGGAGGGGGSEAGHAAFPVLYTVW